MSRYKEQRAHGARKKFGDLHHGDPLFILNPHSMDIEETKVFSVTNWDNPRNVSKEAIEVKFIKPVKLQGVTIDKLEEMNKLFNTNIHKTLIVNKNHYLVITHEHAASIPVPMCTDKEILKAWIRGEGI